MLNFLVLMLILNRFLYKPILNILEDRKRRIRDGEEKVQDLEQRAAQQWEGYQKQLQEAKISATVEKERIKGEGLEAERRLLEEARTEASRSVEEARRKIQEEVSRARDFLKGQANNMALEMAEKILGRGLR
jgi:F-type H+-transporting ATPase subunit b